MAGIAKLDPDREPGTVKTRLGAPPMSLVDCHESGKEVSTSAEKCPNSSARVKSEENYFEANFDMGYSLLGIVLCLGIVFSTLYR